jgi:uncharacterized glyoxalase superfamily protein PhnB
MVKNPPDDMPQITAYLYYKDVKTALEWLGKTFDFHTRMQIPGPDGSIMHAEMSMGDGLIMMGQACAENAGTSPMDLTGVNQSLYVYVDDVEAHYQHAKSLDAPGISEPVDMFWGDRMYETQDLEGHKWAFAQHVKDVAPEDMKPPF